MTRGTAGPASCEVDACDRSHYGHGLCQLHYNRLRRTGTVHKPTEVERFWALVSFGPSCWEWSGHRDPRGYGKFSNVDRVTVGAHRYAYTQLVGPIPAGLHLDHLCRNTSCVNPDHLEAVTPGENVRRGYGPSAVNARKTACKRGHEFTPENTYMKGGFRVCRECRKQARSKHRAA